MLSVPFFTFSSKKLHVGLVYVIFFRGLVDKITTVKYRGIFHGNW